jgi:mono/diheme cytochrome c family protein
VGLHRHREEAVAPRDSDQPREHGRYHALLLATGALGLLVVGALVGGAVLLSGTVSTAATKQHFWITHRLLDVGLHFSVRESASDIQAPRLDDAALVERGLGCYDQHCAQCHGAPGVAPGPAARGLLPVPGNLAQTAREWPPAWLYYVTRKGVRMTGMPAWEYRLAERDLWATVAFLQELPALQPAEYAARAARAPACAHRQDLPRTEDEQGPTLLRQYACHACHVIEGVVGPDSHSGPPLRDWPRRAYIAGVLPNTPANLERWIREPQAVSPGTTMPDLDVPPEHARAMARYLFRQAPTPGVPEDPT